MVARLPLALLVAVSVAIAVIGTGRALMQASPGRHPSRIASPAREVNTVAMEIAGGQGRGSRSRPVSGSLPRVRGLVKGPEPWIGNITCDVCKVGFCFEFLLFGEEIVEICKK